METHLNILIELLKYYFKTSHLYEYIGTKSDINDKLINMFIYNDLKK
jgi:hypothetical protein